MKLDVAHLMRPGTLNLTALPPLCVYVCKHELVTVVTLILIRKPLSGLNFYFFLVSFMPIENRNRDFINIILGFLIGTAVMTLSGSSSGPISDVALRLLFSPIYAVLLATMVLEFRMKSNPSFSPSFTRQTHH